MDPLHLLTSLAVGVAIGIAMLWKSNRGARSAGAAMEAGADVQVFTAMRVPSEGRRIGLGRRWRQGHVGPSVDGQLTFRPYRPRSGKQFDLSGFELVGERPALRRERWWFASDTVLLAKTNCHGTIELGFGPDPWLELARKTFADPAALTKRNA